MLKKITYDHNDSSFYDVYLIVGDVTKSQFKTASSLVKNNQDGIEVKMKKERKEERKKQAMVAEWVSVSINH